ncbi:MAG: tetratricopeptide repeat protein [Verrucomicrobia bacterium]|nr:tetratricopeptide repeat protein [Verrucomicrobiota bacterium]
MNLRLLALVLVAPAATIAADSPHTLFRDGMVAYKKGDFAQSLAPLEQAASGAVTNRLDPAVPLYNAANALMQLGRHDEASNRYQEALRSPDLALQGRAYYNRGNALYRMAETPVPQDKTAGLTSAAIEEALRMYERALFLDPGDEDTKVNYELALQLKKQIEEQQQQQQNQQQQREQEKQENKEQEKEKEKEKEQEQKQEQQNQEHEQQQQPQEQPSKQEPTPAEQMTPEEARMLLDRMKQEEQAYRDQLRVIMGQSVPVDKDW